MATIHTFHLPDPMHTDEWWEYDSPQLPIPNISSYSELSGALVQPVPATVQISPHFQDLVKQSEAPQPHPATYGAFGMTGSTFFPRIPPNVEEHGIIFGTTFEAPRSPKPPVPGTSPPQVPRPGFFGICFVSDQIYPASDTVTMGGPHLGLRSESPHRHLSRTPQGTHSYLQDDRIENPDLCPLERSWKEVDNAFYHGHTDVQPPLSPGSVLPEMGSELSHSQPRSRSESISGQSDDHDHPPMSPDYEDISDDNISDDNISDDNISDDTSDDMSDDEPTLPGSVDQYTHDNHNGTWMCTWPDGSKPSGVCEFISTCPLVKRHIKRMHYRERLVVLFIPKVALKRPFQTIPLRTSQLRLLLLYEIRSQRSPQLSVRINQWRR